MFQRLVNQNLPIGVAGDFASSNPRSNTVGAFVAGASGAIIGHFGWADANDLVSSTGTGAPSGFVGRALNAFINVYGASSSQVIPAGRPCTLFCAGDFYVKNDGSGAVNIGQKAFAVLADGSVKFDVTGATVSGAVETNFYAVRAGVAGDLIAISSNHAPLA